MAPKSCVFLTEKSEFHSRSCLSPMASCVHLSAFNGENDKYPDTKTEIHSNPDISFFLSSALFLMIVAVGSGLTTKFLLLLQNSQRIFWMELSAITLETISHIYKSGANFLCKNPLGSKDANLCHMRRTANFIQYETLEILFSPTPQLHLLAAAHSFLCFSKL